MPDTPYETTEYKIEPHPPLVSQVCGRCGAQVGSRAQHDAWHADLDENADRLARVSWKTRG